MNKSQFLRLCAGKLGLMAAAVCSAFAVSSCTDDEVLDRADKTPLQISVNTESGVSRSLIHDDFLPGGSSIGLSLYNSADGLDYDNQGYSNVKFTATGDGADQTWGTTGLAPSVSANEATLVAYYPYNGADDLDLTAVPVETATQTDYMYSGPVTGINNTNADKVEITMHHALTAVRVQLVLGDYSGKTDVTDISVSSPALGSAATLNTADGALTAITGKGDMLTLPAGFTLAATGTDTDFLLVPDAEVVSGTTTVTATIDGKTYSAGIEFSKAYQQGYIYTYILTLNNTGLSVTKVNVNPWKSGNDDSDELQIYIPDDQYIVEIQVPSDNYEFVHNIVNFVGTVDWGDGTKSDYSTSVTYPTHNYTVAGNYIVTAEGILNQLNSTSTKINGTNITPSKIITKLINIGKDMKVTSMKKAFYNQNNLIKIVTGALDGCCKVTNMEYAFQRCKGLTTLPDGMFDKCTEVTSLYETFDECENLTTIPAGLFDKCTKVTDFTLTLSECSKLQAIPKGLFDYCTEVTSFAGTFRNCSSLQTIPEGLFDYCTKVTDFENTFGIAYSAQVMKIAKIPEGLFDACTEVTNFKHTFYRCTNIREIPGGLFDKCTKVTNFNYTFALTGITEIPEGLFDHCTEVTSFEETFSNCYTLTNIPTGLFDKCPEVSNFCMTFRKAAITNIPVGLFKNNTKVTDMMMTFAECISLTSIPEGLFDSFTEVTRFNGTFQDCSNLEYIPMELFDACTKVTDFNLTFYNCTKLTSESPYTIINVGGEDVKVHLYERANYPVYFTAPTSYLSCFYNCTKLTDYSSIPTEWK